MVVVGWSERKLYISNECERKSEPKRACGFKEEGNMKTQLWAVFIFYGRPFTVTLAHFIPIFSFNTPWNHQKILRHSANFRRYWKGWNVFSSNSNNKWIKAKKRSKLMQPKSSNSGLTHFDKLGTHWHTLIHVTLKSDQTRHSKKAIRHKATSRCSMSYPSLKFSKKFI